MQSRFILGPAGSGKTFHCLDEIRSALIAEPDGAPLLLIAPKQTTYQLERQLLADPTLPGYTRLHILSFERLASFVFESLRQSAPQLLDEEGRVMVLRALLQKKRDQLQLFRASARLTGFAQQLSLALRELQRHQLDPGSLAKLAERLARFGPLSLKLQDFSTLLGDYLNWLKERNLQDVDCLLDFAAQSLRDVSLRFGGIWVDGFTEFSPQELDLLAALLPLTPRATFTFCLDRVPHERISWLAHWSVMRRAYDQCRQRFSKLSDCEITTELLPRRIEHSRFAGNPVLYHLESHWAEPRPAPITNASLRIAICANPEAEATLSAREILRFVRAGGRYREITILARDLQDYHDALVNVFTRYDIPFFLDRRESVSHHPLAELSRNALRTVANNWLHDDWFAALKTGLAPADDAEIDHLENEALARGWKGSTWQKTISIADNPQASAELDAIRRKIIPPFTRFAVNLGRQPTGMEMADALRQFWSALNVEETLRDWSERENDPRPIHRTVWEQMNAWLENVELAFTSEALPLREWLPILDAGLANLTVGVIPPVLDQVFIGAIDRSRNPDIRLALVLGMNETIFPAPPKPSVLLTDDDRIELEKEGITLPTARHQLGHERYFGYVACTRARERLVLTASENDASGSPLNPSPFLAHIQKIFPQLAIETPPRTLDWRKSEHATELIAPLLRDQARVPEDRDRELLQLNDLPILAPLREQLSHLTIITEADSLSSAMAARLYGSPLRTSVSRLEQFAACPFKFFVHSGLRAQERKLFELDVRDQGNFQHEILARFHDELREEKKSWRDIAPVEARERVRRIAAGMLVSFRDGLLQASDEGRFTARLLVESLQDFVETLVDWMRSQYAFDPMKVELPFDESDKDFPPWDLDLGDDHHLLLQGRIDRIDIVPDADSETARCVVVDYKSSQKKLDALLMHHGLQLQLPAYLNVLRNWPDPRPMFGVGRLIPAGVFYVNLRGRYEKQLNRDDTLAGADDARKEAYRHAGRFDAETLALLDQRINVERGDQFNYRRKKDGGITANSKEAMSAQQFIALLDHVESVLKDMGRSIYSGATKVDPYRKGTVIACEQCDYRAICRIDPWTHQYRVLKKMEGDE